MNIINIFYFSNIFEFSIIYALYFKKNIRNNFSYQIETSTKLDDRFADCAVFLKLYFKFC